MAQRVHILQHGDKERRPGDPGLTQEGRRQAAQAADHLARFSVVAVWTSPLRRAVETASSVAERLGLDLQRDDRLRERMNWAGPPVQTLDEFVGEWAKTSADREYRPAHGDSSAEAGQRFLAALADIALGTGSGEVVVVSHGGVTVDAMRSLLGDDGLRSRHPDLLKDGIPCCAVSTVARSANGWVVERIADTSHLSATARWRV